MSALLHEFEAVICECGHPALAHHGVDPNDGCLIVGMRSNRNWCECRLTSTQVVEAAQYAPITVIHEAGR